MPIVGVGSMARTSSATELGGFVLSARGGPAFGWRRRFWLYKETFPPDTGVPNFKHASRMPSMDFLSCQNPSGFIGLPKFRQFVIDKSSAPEQATFLADSATAILAPSYGSR